MKTSDQAIEMLCGFEGFRARPYNDGNPGNATVGYGHLIAHRPVNSSDGHGIWMKGQKRPGQLTEPEARKLLKQRLEREFEPAVRRVAVKAPLNQSQFDATVLFTYNLGTGMLENSHDFGRLLRQRKYQQAADSMLEYVNPGSQWEQGLRKRRAKERALFLKPALSPEQLLVKGWRERLKRVRAKAEERRAKGLVAWPAGLRALANRLKTNIRAHTH
jgi:GH24 family phage-related lysozyme (muramidase)